MESAKERNVHLYYNTYIYVWPWFLHYPYINTNLILVLFVYFQSSLMCTSVFVCRPDINTSSRNTTNKYIHSLRGLKSFQHMWCSLLCLDVKRSPFTHLHLMFPNLLLQQTHLPGPLGRLLLLGLQLGLNLSMAVALWKHSQHYIFVATCTY